LIPPPRNSEETSAESFLVVEQADKNKKINEIVRSFFIIYAQFLLSLYKCYLT
jgi:hypothetical protein